MESSSNLEPGSPSLPEPRFRAGVGDSMLSGGVRAIAPRGTEATADQG
jgi:hypothetical protein